MSELPAGAAKKVGIYLAEEQKYHGQVAYTAVLDFLFYRGVTGAMVMRGTAGFGVDHRMHSTRSVEVAGNLPMKIEFVESAARVDELLPKLLEMAGPGTVEVQDTVVVRPAGERDLPHQQFSLKAEATAKLMRIFFGENDKWNGKPLHEALVEAMRANDIAGVTVYRGILGYGANRRIHQDKALTLSHDRPIMMTIVDDEAKLRAFTPILDRMLLQGLVVLSDVNVIKYTQAYTKGE